MYGEHQCGVTMLRTIGLRSREAADQDGIDKSKIRADHLESRKNCPKGHDLEVAHEPTHEPKNVSTTE